MPIEAELKARVRDVDALIAALDVRATAEVAVYHDHYFDSADGSFTASGRELRVRTIQTSASTRHVLTHKASAVDEASGSKPEHETTVGDVEATRAILHGLGYRTQIAFTKDCRNYRFAQRSRDLLATVVTVPEIEGTFVEVETIVEHDDEVSEALELVREAMTELGIGAQDFTNELYTDAVIAASVPQMRG